MNHNVDSGLDPDGWARLKERERKEDGQHASRTTHLPVVGFSLLLLPGHSLSSILPNFTEQFFN